MLKHRPKNQLATGRSNAINIAKRLGLSSLVIDNARALYGVASAEIDEVIIDMEKFKQDYREHVHEARKSLVRASGIYENLSVARSKLMAYSADVQYRKSQELSEAAASASSLLRNKIRQLRASSIRQRNRDRTKEHSLPNFQEQPRAVEAKHSAERTIASFTPDVKSARSEILSKFPKVGDAVLVSSLGKRAIVLTVEPYKEEIVVQVGNMKLKLKPKDVMT